MATEHRQNVTDKVREIFSRSIPFNHLLGFELAAFDPERPAIRLPMRRELVGNYLPDPYGDAQRPRRFGSGGVGDLSDRLSRLGVREDRIAVRDLIQQDLI